MAAASVESVDEAETTLRESRKMDLKCDPSHYSTLSLWNRETISRIFCGLALSSTANGNLDYLYENDLKNEAVSQILSEELTVSEKMSCSVCNVSFSDRADQLLHFKLDWHCENLRRKRDGKEALARELFEMEDQDGFARDAENDKQSCESDSSKDESDPVEPADAALLEDLRCRFNWHSKLFFENSQDEIIAFHKCLLLGHKDTSLTSIEIVKRTLQLPNQMRWAVLLLSSGHFAAAVYNGNDVVVHKTIHRYVTRAKQGTSQSLHDHHSKHAKSAGANLRRHNELALIENIQELLGSWSQELNNCNLIFYKVSPRSKSSLFGGRDPPLKRNDNRLRAVPFQTKKPTYKETEAVRRRLATLEYFGDKKTWLDRVPYRRQIRPKSSEATLRGKENTSEMDRRRKKNPKEKKDGDVTTSSNPIEKEQLLKSKKTRQHSPQQDRSSTPESQDDGSELIMSYQDELILTSDLDPFGGINLTPTRHGGSTKKKNKQITKAIPSGETKATSNSVLDKDEEKLRDLLYTACCLNDLEKIKSLLGCNDATDQGTPPVDETKKSRIAIILNSKFGRERKSLLHVVSKSGFKLILWILLEHGADPSVPDGKGHMPYILATDKETRTTYRRFRASFADKYDYDAAQVPSALSAEIEAQKLEKRRQQRKLKQVRDKEAKVELKEKNDFLSLAENQKVKAVVELSVKLRCFQCGEQLTKMPFEYLNFKFCSVQCVKMHRQEKKI